MELSKEMYELLNAQYNFEVESANIYLQMSSCLKNDDLPGAASWFLNQYKEEMLHAEKFYNYILERGSKVIVEGFTNPKNEYFDLNDILVSSLSHEKDVTKRISDLMIQARKDNDFAAEIFLTWFITEQVEEEGKLNDLIARLKLYPKDQILLFDQELGQRTAPVVPTV